MQHNQFNMAFYQLPLVAFSWYGQGSVKGAHWAVLCVRPGIHMPFTDSWSYNTFAKMAID